MEKYINSLTDFLDKSVCNFCAVETIKDILDESGYQELDMRDKWNIQKGAKYYTIKNNSAIYINSRILFTIQSY